MNLSSAIPAVGTGVAAAFGLGIWRYQLIAKRRYEIVEQALIAAGEAVQTLHFIRRSQIDDAAIAAQHPDGLRPGSWQTAHGRIQAAETQFSNLRDSIRSIAMHFGENSAESFNELAKIFGEICQAQASLHFRQVPQKLYPTEEHLKDVENWRAILNQQGESDKMTQRINASDSAIKRKFVKYLRPNLFRLFLPLWK